MKIFLDNNILIDALTEREEFGVPALKLLEQITAQPEKVLKRHRSLWRDSSDTKN